MIKRILLGVVGAAFAALTAPAFGWAALLRDSELWPLSFLLTAAGVLALAAGVFFIRDALFYPPPPYVVGTTEYGTDMPCKLYFATESEARKFWRDGRDAGVDLKLDHRLRQPRRKK